MIRIVHLNTSYRMGGAADVARRLHGFLLESGRAESRFLSGRGRGEGPGWVDIGSRLDFALALAAQRFLGQELHLHFSRKIREECEKADVIHLHNLHGYYLHLDRLTALFSELNRPVVWYFHDLWPMTGRCAFPNEPESGPCRRWETGCGACPALGIYPRTFLDRSAFGWRWKNRLFHRLNPEKTVITCPTRWLADRVKRSFLKDYRVEAIPYGLERPPLEFGDRKELRKELNLPEGKTLLLFVAADLRDRRKGLHYLQAIMSRLPDEAMFVSIGKPSDEIRHERLIQLGYQSDRRRVQKIFRACDLYLNPTLAETFSQTTAEAMAVGTPVVAFRTDPLPEVIGPEAGLLVEKGNADALLAGIQSVLSDPARLEAMGRAGKERFLENYTIDRFGNDFLDLYRELSEAFSGGEASR